ncbi:filamentous haemagglutinin family protein, partial [Bradyrhizobium canariense]|uniref:filamentous haemagglutinin family protein n=1 Tax=Bradyrhizobium canariense TaxID=255045 RepID=UPI000A22F543
GVVALAGGAVNAATYGNYIVNTSRVFTLGGGDLLMWSSEGNVDAGKGARTVAGAPAPVFYLDNNGNLQVDTSAAISGSGIASSHDLDVYAPHGIVDSGEAGLRSAGAASLGGARVVCIGCSFGVVVGLPAAAPVVTPVAATSVLPD